MRPPPGVMVHWRFKNADREWRFGYCTYESGSLIRMGRWNGDTNGGSIVDASDIEWRKYE